VPNKRRFPVRSVTAPATCPQRSRLRGGRECPTEFSPIANPGSNRISIRRALFQAAYHPLSRFHNSVPPEGRRAGASQYDQLILESKPVLLAPLNAKLFYRGPPRGPKRPQRCLLGLSRRIKQHSGFRAFVFSCFRDHFFIFKPVWFRLVRVNPGNNYPMVSAK
jgi:hypothetical protein